MTATGKRPPVQEPRKHCDEIRPLLLEYMTRELGSARSDYVREHLRKCEDCQAAAREIQAALEALRKTSGAAKPPTRLTEERRARLIWAFTHPIRAWIFAHHIAVSVVIALIVLGGILAFLRWKDVWFPPEPIETTLPVVIGIGKPGIPSAPDTNAPPKAAP